MPVERFRAKINLGPARAMLKQSKGRTFTGIGMAWLTPSVDREPALMVTPGAFKASLANRDRVPLLLYHDEGRIAGAAVAREGRIGLEVTAEFVAVPDGEIAAELVRTGVVAGLSLGINPVQIESVSAKDALARFGARMGGTTRTRLEKWTGLPIRVCTAAELLECSLTPWPAIPGSGVGLSKPKPPLSDADIRREAAIAAELLPLQRAGLL